MPISGEGRSTLAYPPPEEDGGSESTNGAALDITTQQVWDALAANSFGVLAFTNARGEPRTAGVVYILDGHRLLIATGADAWKVRHIERHPSVSMTVTEPKRVPFMPFIKVPAATITFQGVASIKRVTDYDPSVTSRLFRGLQMERDAVEGARIIEVVPEGEFVTYGIAMPMLKMRDTDAAGGRAPCGAAT